MVVEVSAAQVHHSNTLAASVDQLTIADIDAHVGGKAAVLSGILKENQIAALQLLSGNDDTAAQLIVAGTADGVAHHFVNIGCKTRAIETLGGSTAPNIGHTLILQSLGTDLAPQSHRVLGISGFQGLGLTGTDDAVYIIFAVSILLYLGL